jgi:succinate dehydrogenase flavin-adding protein (antitoxin of CptAB toxin-antitoxin module)
MTEGSERLCGSPPGFRHSEREADLLLGERAMDVKLSSEESDVLLEILEEQDQTLLDEISHTKREAPKKTLRQKETLLESIIEKLAEQRQEEEFTDLWW